MSFIHQCLIFDSHPAELLPQFCYLLFRSDCLYAMYIYISLTLCYIRYISLTRTEVFNSKGNFLFIFFFYECKLGDIILKVVSLLKIKNIHIDSITITTLFDYKRLQVMLLCIF